MIIILKMRVKSIKNSKIEEIQTFVHIFFHLPITMPTPFIYNRHTCSCGMPFSSLRLLKSHYQLRPSHKITDTDTVMEEAEQVIVSSSARKLY